MRNRDLNRIINESIHSVLLENEYNEGGFSELGKFFKKKAMDKASQWGNQFSQTVDYTKQLWQLNYKKGKIEDALNCLDKLCKNKVISINGARPGIGGLRKVLEILDKQIEELNNQQNNQQNNNNQNNPDTSTQNQPQQPSMENMDELQAEFMRRIKGGK